MALVDSGGETVDYAGKYDLFELKVMAAHFRIPARHGRRARGRGRPAAQPGGARAHALDLALLAPDGYAVVVVLGRRAGFAVMRLRPTA